VADKYPFRCIGLDSELVVEDDVRVDRAIDGTGRGRAFYTTPKAAWRVVHPAMRWAQVQELATFYAAHRTVPFDFDPIHEEPAISGLMTQPPRIKPLGNGLFRVEVSIVQIP
jgi:hypothetical protein